MESGQEIPFDKVTTHEAKRFGPSERALKQRRWLVLGVKALALSCLLVILLSFQPPMWWAELLKWAIAAALVWGVWRMPGKALLEPMQQRSLTLHEHAIELNRGGFRRFIVFESLRHIQLLQGSNERLVALVLHTADDSVVIRDFEGLGEVFAALSAAKPPSVLIEVEGRPIDWGEPLPWAIVFGCLALLVAFFTWSGGLDKTGYYALVGKWLVVDGGALALWRPASQGADWHHHIPEVFLGGIFASLGFLFA